LTDLKYRAFVSFSHEPDERLAASLQSSLTRFAKPWYKVRSMRIFRDESSLAANSALWNSIELALAQCEYFLLLASPASAKSIWVQQEVQWWLQHRTVDKLVICLTDGVILWDTQNADFDWAKTTAMPLSLKHAFTAEPLYADFRAAKSSGKFGDSDPQYRGALLDVAAPLMGRPKDELDSEDIRLHRKAQRAAFAVALFVVFLGLIAAVAMNTAHQRQMIAASRALASEAASPRDDRSLAMLLSIESRRIADTVESRRSLLASIQRVPNAEAFLWGHADAVTRAVFSPDGQTILSAGWDDRLILWSAASHQLMGQPIAAPKGLVGVAFNPDGTRFASATRGAIVIWDTKSREPVGDPLKADEEFEHVAFSANGNMLAASTAAYGGRPSHVFLWDIAAHKQVVEPILGSNFAFSTDDTLLAIVRYDELVLFDLRSLRVLGRPLTGPTKNIASLAFSDDNTIVAAGGEDKSIVLWDVKSHRSLGTLTGQPETVTSLRFDARGETLYSGSPDGTIIHWGLEHLEALDTPVKGFGAAISSIFLAADGHVRSLALEQDRVIILNVGDDPALGRRIEAPGSGESNIAFSSDGRLLASGAEFGDVSLWDVASGEMSGTPLSGHERQVSSLAFTPDGKTIVSASMDGTIIFSDLATRSALGPAVKADRSPVWSLACSRDGKTMIAGGDSELVFWDIATRKQAQPAITSQKDRIWALAFSPSGDLLAAAGNSLRTALWSTGAEHQLLRILGSPMPRDTLELMPAGVSFSPDGTLLATSTLGHSVTLWKAGNGRPILPVLYGHTQAVSSVAFNGDGKVLASGSADGDIRLWDVTTHELLGTLSSRQKAIHSIAFEPHSGILASAGEDNSIIFWSVDFAAWRSRACRIANRNLTLEEWNVYLGTSPYQKTCPDI
jgi:WD40 repeat protein